DRLDRGGITAVLPAAASGARTRAPRPNALSAISVSASIEGSRWSAPSRSCASPPVRKKSIGLPSASTKAWILVLSPPRERPIAWSSPAFLGAGAMLVGAHNGAVDHRIFVVGVCGEMLKHPLPDTAFGPTAEPSVDLCPLTEPLRQIAPWHPGTIAVQHRLNEQSIVRRGHPDRAFAPGQQVFDPLPRVVT